MIAKNSILVGLTLLVLVAGATGQTGGPGNPDFMQFKPATATDLVNLSNGSFSYNIPLFDVGGYPINLSYQSGIGMEDVASSVGLGWSINTGSVTHSMRGLPDDFMGDVVTRTIHMKPNTTYGGNLGLGAEIAGLPLGFNVGYGIFYNTYNGWGVEQSYGLSFSLHKEGSALSGGLSLGMKANTQSGVDLMAQPSVALKGKVASDMAASGSLGGLITINSAGGLKGSINASIDLSATANYTTTTKARDNKGKGKLNGQKSDETMSSQFLGASAAYSFSKTPDIPRVSYPFQTSSFAGSFKAGGEVWFLHLHGEVRGYSSTQSLAVNTIATPAYGFLYSDQSNGKGSNVLHDYQTEKDGPYIKDAAVNIGIPSFTNDIYSVDAQGISGSFQLSRNDIGVVFNNQVVTSGSAGNIGIEVGFGNAFHVGAALSTTSNFSQSGKWASGITPNLAFEPTQVNSLYQSAYFKNASDVSIDENNFYDKLMGEDPVEVHIKKTPWYVKNVDVESELITDNGAISAITAANSKKYTRDPRTIDVQYKTASQAKVYGLRTTIDVYEINRFACDSLVTSMPREGGMRRGHHVSEMTSTNVDGMRYVFGLPTYNVTQKEVSFTLDHDQQPDAEGLVDYDSATNWGYNGKDGFYEATTLPAYVTSHLLTAVLSPEYIDVDGNGPSLNDVGNYVKINYAKAGNYRWRTPYARSKATFNKAFLSDQDDNKGSYVYGEKEQYYTHSIESKTQIAEFYYDKTGRTDGLGVLSEHGGLDVTQKLLKLDSIKVYSINERVIKGAAASPIRIIYFTYDNSLCDGVHNSSTGQGKLTLKKVAFASGKSRRELLSPYKFTYGTMPNTTTANATVVNPNYRAMQNNRWGYFQKSGYPYGSISDPLSLQDFPYASQDEAQMTENAYAWNMTSIKLPSGGTISVEYEPHRYAYTQDIRAGQMVSIVGSSLTEPSTPTGGTFTGDQWLIVKLPVALPATDQDAYLKQMYFNNDLNRWYYYKALVRLRDVNTNVNNEWISGYAKIAEIKAIGTSHAAIRLKGELVNDFSMNPQWVSPIRKNAWQFMRMNRQDLCYGPALPPGGGLEHFLKLSDLNSKVGDQFTAFFKGFNSYALDKGFANDFVPDQSFIRLFAPTRDKIIGGARVKRVTTNDDWDQQSQQSAASKAYTIDYEYTRTEKDPVSGKDVLISSGVMEYEPFNGQDENMLRKPVFIDQHIKMAPDNRLFIEEPYNENLFPASNLTYSNVRVTTNKTALKVPSTGYQEHEFFTARDYPVRSSITLLGENHEKKTSFLASFAMSIMGISESHDYVTLSQGAVITLNDMHGKQKATRNYNSNGALISSESSEYALGSELELIGNAGAIYRSDKLGVSVSAICDSKSTEHRTDIAGVNLNLDFAVPPPISMFIPLPNMSTEHTRLNTVAFNKIIKKKGILVKKSVTESGASVSTENVLFDDKTGFVVLSKTTNEYSDSIYKYLYPAHWIYQGLSAAYQSSGLTFTATHTSPGNVFSVSSTNVYGALVPGDEIIVKNSAQRLWVMKKTSPNLIQLESSFVGTTVTIPSGAELVVVRPGRRNQLTLEAGTIVSLKNPIAGNRIVFSEIGSEARVVNASMQVFNDVRIPFCACPPEKPQPCEPTNPPVKQ